MNLLGKSFSNQEISFAASFSDLLLLKLGDFTVGVIATF